MNNIGSEQNESTGKVTSGWAGLPPKTVAIIGGVIAVAIVGFLAFLLK